VAEIGGASQYFRSTINKNEIISSNEGFNPSFKETRWGINGSQRIST
jgi:hypothetical protein